ncbi:glycoside hydrolase [Bacteroidota bacterium]|nr:glycoside hydrolase [Bacteroidota bacterium]MDC3229970.1 glycoside hydrolase [Bacteroidota bacterium]
MFTQIKIILFLVLCPILLFSQLNFNSHITVSSGNDGFGRPRIALDANNDPFIVYRNNMSPKTIRISKWNGNGFASPYDITTIGIQPSSQDGPEIAAKGDTIYVVFTSSATTHSSIMMIRSFDGGITFSDTIRVSENDSPQICRMGNVAINEQGQPVISYMKNDLSFSTAEQMVRTSNDFGLTFGTAVNSTLNSPDEPCDCCKASLLVSGNNIYVLFRNNENNKRNSYVSKSSNYGASFDLVNEIDDYDWILNSCPSSVSRGVFMDDSLLIVKKSGATGNNEIVLTSISSVTLDYSYNLNIDEIPNVNQRYPEISNSSDSIFIVWQDDRSGGQNCFLSYSYGGIKNLSTGISFTDSTFAGPKFNPHLTFKNGTLHLVYIDFLESSIKYVRAYVSSTTNIKEIEYFMPNRVNFDILGRKNHHGFNKLKFLD